MQGPDNSLIAEFNARRSEDAFAALVRQHVNLVFATAMRQVGDAGAAEEITQNVFVALAQAAGKLGSHPTIAGWLHQTALNKSREWLRSELRRRKREQVAVNLDLARAEGDSVWSPLVPLLDEALLELREPDRQAVILHFMEGRTFQEVGSALGVGEDAARKRVDRCLGQLANFFRHRGFAAPALAVGAPLFTFSSHVAPAGLAASATSAGLAAHSTASTLTLIKGALKIMAWTKAKTAIVVGVVAILAAGTTTTLVVRHQHQADGKNSAGKIGTNPGDFAPDKIAFMGNMRSIKAAVIPAFIQYAQAHQDEIPKSMADLQPYLPPDITGMDDDHWEILASGKLTPQLTQKDTVLFQQKNLPSGQYGNLKIVGYTDGHLEGKR